MPPPPHLPVSETVGQLVDGAGLVGASDTESANLLPPELHVLLRELLRVQALEVLDRRLVVRQLVGRVLRVLGELESAVTRDGTLDGVEGAGDQVEQG
jgi:hypothetical protein